MAELKETIFNKFKEQPFIVILLIVALYFQNQMHEKSIAALNEDKSTVMREYETRVKEERDLLISNRTGLVESVVKIRDKADAEKEELYERLITEIKALNNSLVECEKSKQKK